ncbi:MAG: peptidyl-prolyl cis-trans isomerase [Spirochaetaceae bacterium]
MTFKRLDVRKAVVFCVGAAVTSGLLGVAPVSAQVLDQPVAVVRFHETENIGQRQMREQQRLMEQQLGEDLSEEDRQELVEAQINEVLISQAAAESDVRVSDEELRQAIDRQRASAGQGISEEEFRGLIEREIGMSWDEYRSQIRQRLIQEKFVMERKRGVLEGVDAPTERDIREFYEENATRFTNPAMVRFRHAFVDTRGASEEERRQARERAEELYESIDRGEKSFDQVIREADDDASYSGGDFGYLMRQDEEGRRILGREFIAAVFDLEEGELSDEPLESEAGYHIVEITNRRSARVLGLDDPVLPGQNITVRGQIRNYLMANQQQLAFQRAVREVVEELREEADITVYEENLDW